MGAAKFIGRVGGLAVALGVGTAAFAGQGVASADTGSSAGQDNRSASSDSSPSHSSKGLSKASSARTAGASRSSGNGGGNPRGLRTAAAASPDLPTADSDQDAPVAASSVTDSTRVSTVPSRARVSSAPPRSRACRAVVGFLSAVVDDLLNPASGSGPSAPADAPLSWLFTAFSRREVGRTPRRPHPPRRRRFSATRSSSTPRWSGSRVFCAAPWMRPRPPETC